MFTKIRRAFSFYPSQDGQFMLPLVCEKHEGFGFTAFSFVDLFQAQLTVVDGDALWLNRRIMGLPMKEYITRQLNDALHKMQQNGIEPKTLSHGDLKAQLLVAKGGVLSQIGLRLDGVKLV